MYAIIIRNCKAMCSKNTTNEKLIFSPVLFNILISNKVTSAVVNTKFHQPENQKNYNKRIKILNSLLRSEISPFINTNQFYLLKTLFRSRKQREIFYRCVINYNVAEDIVGKILPHIAINKDIVVEANPGLGLITLCLINSNVPKIIILDSSGIKPVSVNQLMHYYQNQLVEVELNFIKYPGQYLKNLIKNSVELNVPTKVIGVISNTAFLSHLINSYIRNELWDTMHYLEFYLVVTPTIFLLNKNIKKYFSYYLINFMLKFEGLGIYPSEAFLPNDSNNKNSLYLFKITANLNLIKSINKNDLKDYVFFLKILSRKNSFIIPTLEKFVSNCGLYLISYGVSMSNKIQDFSPAESVLLFNLFQKCKGYDQFKTLRFSIEDRDLATDYELKLTE